MKTTAHDEEYLDRVKLAAFLEVSYSTAGKIVKTADFPRPIRFTKSMVRWRRSEVAEWMERRRLAS